MLDILNFLYSPDKFLYPFSNTDMIYSRMFTDNINDKNCCLEEELENEKIKYLLYYHCFYSKKILDENQLGKEFLNIYLNEINNVIDKINIDNNVKSSFEEYILIFYKYMELENVKIEKDLKENEKKYLHHILNKVTTKDLEILFENDSIELIDETSFLFNTIQNDDTYSILLKLLILRYQLYLFEIDTIIKQKNIDHSKKMLKKELELYIYKYIFGEKFFIKIKDIFIYNDLETDKIIDKVNNLSRLDCLFNILKIKGNLITKKRVIKTINDSLEIKNNNIVKNRLAVIAEILKLNI